MWARVSPVEVNELARRNWTVLLGLVPANEACKANALRHARHAWCKLVSSASVGACLVTEHASLILVILSVTSSCLPHEHSEAWPNARNLIARSTMITCTTGRAAERMGQLAAPVMQYARIPTMATVWAQCIINLFDGCSDDAVPPVYLRGAKGLGWEGGKFVTSKSGGISRTRGSAAERAGVLLHTVTQGWLPLLEAELHADPSAAVAPWLRGGRSSDDSPMSNIYASLDRLFCHAAWCEHGGAERTHRFRSKQA